MQAAVLAQYGKYYGTNAQSVLHENATLTWIQRKEGINYDGTAIADSVPSLSEIYGSEENNEE